MKIPNKTARLAVVVAQCGTPEPVTLWTSPRKDPHFQATVEQNRILTVRQETVGTRKDFGVVGFHKEPNVSYWIFPKALDAFEDKKIVGINYDLLKIPEVKGPLAKVRPPARRHKKAQAPVEPIPEKAQPALKPSPAPPPPPAPPRLSKFRVIVRCVLTVELPQQLEAKNKREAKVKALKEATGAKIDFEKGEQERRVVKVEELASSEIRNPTSRAPK